MRFWVTKDSEVISDLNWEDAFIVSINRECRSTAYSNLSVIWHQLGLLHLEPIYEDLFIIGLSVYSLDKRVKRKQFADCWTRDIEVSIPVLQYEDFKGKEAQWNEMLSYLTGDHWQVQFRRTEKMYSLYRRSSRRSLNISNCDCVSLFSGGLDSYCGALYLLERQHNPCLIGHNEYPKLRYKQYEFVENFKKHYCDLQPTFISFTAGARAPINEAGEALKGVENTSRSRSLLFLCAAISIAGIIGEDTPVYIPENGFIGLNVALTKSRKGSCSTRTTHPYFLRMFRKILIDIGINNPIYNFFEFKTKREIVQMHMNLEAFQQGYFDTISCSHPCVARYNRTGSREYPINCGYCYPCIVRRAALLDIDDQSKHSSSLSPSEFLREFEESDRSADLRAMLSSVHRFQNCNDREIDRLIRCTGKLTAEEVESFRRVYIHGMNDIIQWLSMDTEIEIIRNSA